MKLREYLNAYKIKVAELVKRTGIGYSTIYTYLSGNKKPGQENAEILERETGGRVTVKELRGKDDRDKG